MGVIVIREHHTRRCLGGGGTPSASRVVVLLIVGLACLLGAAGVAGGGEFAPPAPPRIPPLIATTYSNDLNRNAIDDELESKAVTAMGRLKSAVTSKETKEAETLLAGTVEVELIFNDQVTQRQIDDFLGRGGEITYIYKAVSYGWNGRIAIRDVNALPSLMGSTLVLVQEAKPVVLHLDVATRSGRVRPVWAAGFAGNPSGFDGSDTITIAVLDTGIDANHSDLSGRQVYWRDFSDDGNVNPVDIVQHGSHVAGIALGTGAAGGSAAGTLYCTDVEDLTDVPSGSFYIFPIGLPSTSVTYSSTARWTGGGSTSLYQAYHTKGTSSGWAYLLPNSATGTSPLTTVTNSFTASTSRAYSTALLSDGGTVKDFVIANSVTNYPGVGDGFNKLRGVAPGCSWAAAKVFRNDGSGYNTWVSAAVDVLVPTRVANKIKVMNLSLGVDGTDTTLRGKVNTAVNNGIVVAVSAGNSGPSGQIGDPGRAAMALTVVACNDEDQLTAYSSIGFSSPGSGEDYKPDITAPGGSAGYYTSILSVDSGSADGPAFADQQPNDYASMQGTSMASPFAAGAAALVIDAMEQQGITWDFNSNQHSRYVKMVLCATASETNTTRENNSYNPTLQRAASGPSGFPAGKDPYEGYGIINPDAAVEAVSASYTPGSSASDTLGPGVYDRRVWARKVQLQSGVAFGPNLNVPPGGDFDLYLYSDTPSAYGTPIILASSTQAGNDFNESISYTPPADTSALLVVKRVSGSGMFGLTTQTSTSVALTVTSTTGGTVTEPGAGTFTYPAGSIVNLVASADASCHFVSWTGDVGTIANVNAADTTITMDANYAIVANFTPQSASNEVGIIGSWATGATHAKESGADRALIFIAHANSNTTTDLTGVTYGGQPMTKIIDKASGSSGPRVYTAAFDLNEAGIAAAANDTFVVNWGNTPGSVSYSSVFLSDVNQTALIGASASASVKDTSLSTSALSTKDGDMVIAAATCNNTGDYTLNNGFTEAIDLTVPDFDGVDGYKSATGVDETPSVTHSAGGRQALIGFVVQVAPVAPPAGAAEPDPPDLATDVDVNADLIWTAGAGATSHDVYFGTVSPGEFQGNQPETTFDPGTMSNGTTCYWRIDEKNAAGTTEGEVWSFTTIPARTLTVSSGEGGGVTDPGEGGFNYPDGNVVDLVASAYANYHFVSWTGTAVDAGKVVNPASATTTVTMDGDYTVVANFAIDTHTVTFIEGANGSITGTLVQVVNHGGDCTAVTAADNPNYHFDGWTGDYVGMDNPLTIQNVTADMTITANFAIDQRALTASSTAGGTVSTPGIGTYWYDHGTVVDLVATSDLNYHFVSWTGTAVDAGKVANPASATTTVTMDGDYTVVASFAIDQSALTVTFDENGSVDPNGVITVDYGDDQLFTATADLGYEVDEWFVDGDSVQTGGNTYTLTNITADHTVSVAFREIMFAIWGYVVELDGNTPVESALIQADVNEINSVTDSNGFYELLVDYNWSGVVTPQKDGYVFEPNSDTYTNVTQDYNDANYTATLMTFKIAGYVLEQDYITPISDANVSAENGGGAWTSRYGGGASLTDANGCYETLVDYNWSGNITPAKYAYAFEPNGRYYQDVNEDYVEDQNYTGTLLTFIITGCITNECNVPIEGVLVDAQPSAGLGGGKTVTDVNGLYEVWVDYNWSGTVTPTKSHYTFDPNRTSYVDVLADQPDQNYIAYNIYDLDCDGSIGLGDVAVMANNWLMSGAEIPCNFVADEAINFLDFAEFGAAWRDDE